MDKQEYTGIKAEIIQLSKLRMQLAVLFLGLISTMIGYVYGSSTSPDASSCDKLVLGASTVFLILAIFIENLRRHLRRLTTYIYVYFEESGESADYRFETSWKKFREREQPWSYSAPIALLMLISLVLGMVSLWFYEWNDFNWWKMNSIIASVLGLCFLWFSTIFKQKSQESEKHLVEVWKEIKKANTEGKTVQNSIKDKEIKMDTWIKLFSLVNGFLAIFLFILTCYQIFSDKPNLKIKLFEDSCMISQIHQGESYGVYLEFQVYNNGKRSTGILESRLQLKIGNQWQSKDGFEAFVMAPNLYFKEKFALALITNPFGYETSRMDLLNPSLQNQIRFNKLNLVLDPGAFHGGYAFFPLLTQMSLTDKVKARILVYTPHKLYKSKEFLLNMVHLERLKKNISVPNISFEEFKKDFDQRLAQN